MGKKKSKSPRKSSKGMSGWALLLSGVGVAAGATWLANRYGTPTKTSNMAEGLTIIGQIGQDVGKLYIDLIRHAGINPTEVNTFNGRHVVVVFPPEASQTIQARVSLAERVASEQGLKVGLASGPGKVGVVFTDDPKAAEGVLAADGYTTLQPSSAFW